MAFARANLNIPGTHDTSKLVVRIGKETDTVLAVRQILLQPYLTVVDSEADSGRHWNIAGFTTLIHWREDDAEEQATGEFERLSSKQTSQIKRLKPGDTIFFDNIRGETADGRIIKLPSFTIVIR